VSLLNVWVRTLSDGLVRGDRIVGIDAHQTPELAGKSPRWLLDVVLPTPIGSGSREGWGVTALHRTLAQTPHDPGEAPVALARLLAQLDHISAAGIVTVSREDRAGAEQTDEMVAGSPQLRFRFVPFASPAPGHHTGAEYL
jgi:hypothetical protein